MEELHAFMATLSLWSTTLFQKPYDHIWQAEAFIGGEAPEIEERKKKNM